MKTTLNKIREHHPCKDGWEKLLRYLDKTQPDDELLSLEEILDSNGLGDALWCLQAVEGHDREARLYAVWCARQVQHLMTDPRSIAALDVSERYARGQASSEELAAARAEAESAAREAWEPAVLAASEAAVLAASEAAVLAAREAAWKARTAAWEAAWKARTAARTEAGASAAKGQAAIDAQVAEFCRVCRAIDAGRDPYLLEAKP